MIHRYFDYNATTPLTEAAKEAWLNAAQTQWLNPSSPYRSAASVKVRYEACREALAAQLHVSPKRVVFTSGATEANNAVIRHWASRLPEGARIGINSTEHPSVIEPAKTFLGDRVEWLRVDANGLIDLGEVSQRVRSGELAAVSVMAANNETGVLQPWQALAAICRAAKVPYHCDASQWVGKMPLDGLDACDYVTACAHKFGGPKGVGWMLLPSEDTDFGLLAGGAQEMSHRAGTEDVAGVSAMMAALQASVPGDAALRDEFIEQVRSAIPAVRVVGAGTPRLWNTVSMIMPTYRSVRWIRGLEKLGFLVSAGSACSTAKASVSTVLLEMGMDAGAADRVLRMSAGIETGVENWSALASALADVYRALESESSTSNSQVISID